MQARAHQSLIAIQESNALAWPRHAAIGVAVVVILLSSAGRAETVLRPEQFGAKGDGIADDSQAIQHAIDQVAALPADEHGHKGTIILDKSYYVTRQVQVSDDTSPEHKRKIGPHWRIFHVPSGVTINGKGMITLLQDGKSSRDTPASYTYVFWVSTSPDGRNASTSHVESIDPTPTRDDTRVRNVIIRNIAIINDPASLYPVYSETSAINVKYGSNVHVDGVKFRHWHRSVIMMHPVASSVINCVVEDTRYIGVGLYGISSNSDEEQCRIENNTIRGNTQLSGGIYINGKGAKVRNNTLYLTHGIWGEGISDYTVEKNHISRSPYGIRLGYIASSGAKDGQVRDNTVSACVSGIMLGNASNVRVEDNVIEKFAEPGSDMMIEPPYGYWGFGREPAGINVEDCADLTISGNQVKDLNRGVPVGIRVANSRFTIDYERGCYGVTDAKDPPGINLNSGNQVIRNHVEVASGMGIAYYVENQSAMVFSNNNASGDSGGRLIGCSGTIKNNTLSGKLCDAEVEAADCPRLILKGHPAHWDGIAEGAFKFTAPPPPFVEYFPTLPSEIAP